MKRAIFFLIVLFIIEFTGACMQKQKVIEYYYVNCGLTTTHIDNSGANALLVNEGSIAKEAYGIQLSIELKEKMCFSQPQFSLPSFNQCYALGKSTPRVQISYLNKITDIKITTLMDFDNTHPAGSDISEYFKVFSNNSFTSIEAFIEQFQKTNEIPSLDFVCNLLLIESSFSSGTFQFKTQALLEDGTSLDNTTSLIELL